MKVKAKRKITVGEETIDPGRILTDEQVKLINPRNLKAMESTGHIEIFKEMGSEEFDKLQAENEELESKIVELKDYIKELESELDSGKQDSPYSGKDIDELRELCKERKISLQGFGTAGEDKLIKLLEKHDKEKG